jgi:hypothetical protein
VLPKIPIKSLKSATVRKPQPRSNASKRPQAAPPVLDDGTLSLLGRAVLTALAEQSDHQQAHNDWNGSRVPNGMLQLPDGVSESKYRKVLTQLRRAGYV